MKEGQCSGRKGPGKGRSESGGRTHSPLGSGARGSAASPAASSTSWPTALDGTGRPGILARRPSHGCGTRSLNAPFLDPRGHQRACTGKRPVSRGEAHSAYISIQTWTFSVPLLSHTPTPVGSLVKGCD